MGIPKRGERYSVSRKGMGGRPTIYDATILAVIVGRIAEGETMRSICRDQSMPNRGTVYRWLSKKTEFSTRYAEARELRMACMADEILEIADDGTTDFVLKVGRNGHEYLAVDQEHIQRSRLRVDARKWLLSKLEPAQYGDHVEVAHSGQVTVQHELSDRERMRRMALFLLEDQAAEALEGQSTRLPEASDSLSVKHDKPLVKTQSNPDE